MTKSVLFESIQQSPIDPLMTTDDMQGEGLITPELAVYLLEEIAQDPPKETSFASGFSKNEARLRMLEPRAWAEQIPSEGLEGTSGISITRLPNKGLKATRVSGRETVEISPDGVTITYRGMIHKLSNYPNEVEKIPIEALQLMEGAYGTITAWRSRIVRLSMDTDEYECSLMDDLSPPRTFIVEIKARTYPIRSVRIQSGLVIWETREGRIVSIPTTILEDDGLNTKVIHELIPELRGIQVELLWFDLIQLRGMCLDEDRRILCLSPQTCIAGG